jgi:hypothetical protein
MGGLGGDNMSIIIICFLHGKPWQNLVDRCKRIHAERKTSSKLSEPAFSAFDRFAADGPFNEVSVLRAADDLQNTSSSSSSSSSPISTEEKFDLNDAPTCSKVADKRPESSDSTKGQQKDNEKSNVDFDEVVDNSSSSDLKNESDVAVEASSDSIVSNGD